MHKYVIEGEYVFDSGDSLQISIDHCTVIFKNNDNSSKFEVEGTLGYIVYCKLTIKKCYFYLY